MYLRLLMGTSLNPADYGVPSGASLSVKEPGVILLVFAIRESLARTEEVYLAKVALHISRECQADEYFMNIGMYNMYTLLSGGSSLDYQANVGL